MPSSSESNSDPIPAAPSQVPSRQIRVITSLLRRAVTLFVRSQLTAVQTLDIDLGGGDRQLLAGFIPRVALAATGAVYQGLHLSQIQIEGQDIQINLGQILRGKALRLLDEIGVTASLSLDEADLNASLSSPLFDDLLCRLVEAIPAYLPAAEFPENIERQDIQTVQAQLLKDKLCLEISFAHPPELTGKTLVACAQLALKGSRMLTFRNVQLALTAATEMEPSNATIPYLPIPLGSDVDINTLALEEKRLHCQGTIRVRP